jgi:hypothetical protein
MKILIIASVFSTFSLYSQGTIDFSNIGEPLSGLNAPVYGSDHVTKLSGPQFMAELFAGNTSDNLAPLATTSFLTGNEAGYFLGGTQTVSGVPGGATAWVQVDVWNTASGASFSLAQASGLPNSWWQSTIFNVVTGNSTINPTPPGALLGLGDSPVFLNEVPEPSPIALLGLAASMALFHMRRCRSQSKAAWTLGTAGPTPSAWKSAEYHARDRGPSASCTTRS